MWRPHPGIYTTSKPPTEGWWTPVRRSTARGDGAPTLAVDGGGKAYLVYRRAAALAGLYSTTNRSGRGFTQAKVTGTGGADLTPAAALAGTTLHLAFRRTGSGVYVTAEPATSAWATPSRRSTSAADITPALATDSTHKTYVVFDRG